MLWSSCLIVTLFFTEKKLQKVKAVFLESQHDASDSKNTALKGIGDIQRESKHLGHSSLAFFCKEYSYLQNTEHSKPMEENLKIKNQKSNQKEPVLLTSKWQPHRLSGQSLISG